MPSKSIAIKLEEVKRAAADCGLLIETEHNKDRILVHTVGVADTVSIPIATWEQDCANN